MGSRRVDLKAILADEDLRRELMVPTLQATQAREGIETTRDQAERAYYVVNEADKAAFFDLARIRNENQGDDSRKAVFLSSLHSSKVGPRFDVARKDFRAIEGSPLAFRRVRLVAHIFRDSSALEPAWGIARQGKATGDDPRWIRYWWEISGIPHWVPFAKGGPFSRFYSDVHLSIDWARDHREALKASGNGLPSEDLYFQQGLTWPRAASVFNARVMPSGCVFADKGPVVFARDKSLEWLLLAFLNSEMALCFGKTLTSRENMGGRWEVGVVKRFPVPDVTKDRRELLSGIAKSIHDAKAVWDEGNETSTRFNRPWLLLIDLSSLTMANRLDRLAEFEASEEARIQQLYAELNDEVYKLYGIPEATRATIEETLGERPPEILWPQMEGKTADQKRMEHVWRLLSYVVGRVVEADEDGIVPFMAAGGETALIDRVLDEIAALFPDQDVNQVEVDITNELKRKVKGYRPVQGIREWLEGVFFEYHVSLYKKRPILWHIASSQGHGACAVGALCHYHKFNHDRLSKLRGTYLRDAIALFRREAAIADQEGRTEDRQDWQSRLEEAEALDQRLQWVQEGVSGYPAPGDCRIRTPWKSDDELPKGWQPDLDDGVAVNILPLQTAGVLRIPKVV